MFKYIKWELLSIGKKYWKFIAAILALFFLVAVIPVPTDDANTTVSLLYIPFSIIMIILFFGAFVFGTKKVIDTFRRKTFLLESMISLSPAKILFAKYLMAIIINLACVILFVTGISVIVAKAIDFDTLIKFAEEILNIGIGDWLKVGITLLLITTSFTSLITLCYVTAKCIIPNGKGSVVIGVIIWYLLNFVTEEILSKAFSTSETFLSNENFLLYSIINIVFISIYYLVTVKLIEHKLEIYN